MARDPVNMKRPAPEGAGRSAFIPDKFNPVYACGR